MPFCRTTCIAAQPLLDTAWLLTPIASSQLCQPVKSCHCTQVAVEIDERHGRMHEPKYDVTSKGHKTLDLGFGSSRGQPGAQGLDWQLLQKASFGQNS